MKNPNLLFVFSDQQHWQATGFEDASFHTPTLDRLATEGVVFENSFCTTPQCSPSRSSLMTGLYPTKTGVLGNVGAAGGDPLHHATIGGVLQRAGYRTAYFGKWHLGKDPLGTAGWDEDMGVTGPDCTDDAAVTRRAVAFIETSRGRDRPFALFLSYNNPHDVYHFGKEKHPVPRRPVTLPETWRRKDLSTTPRVQRQFMTEDQGRVIHDAEAPAWERYRELYREKVVLYDRELGVVIGALEACGLLDETAVVATSDHGDMDTQHRLIYKGPFMYEHMVRVPLIIRLPAVARRSRTARRSAFLTVNVDLAPTLADLAGTALPDTDGLSLTPFLLGDGKMPRRDFVVGQYYSKQLWVNPIRMIRDARYKYNLYRVHGEELYDLQSDPMELHNVASESEYADVKSRLKAALDGWISEHNDPFYTQRPTTRDGCRTLFR